MIRDVLILEHQQFSLFLFFLKDRPLIFRFAPERKKRWRTLRNFSIYVVCGKTSEKNVLWGMCPRTHFFFLLFSNFFLFSTQGIDKKKEGKVERKMDGGNAMGRHAMGRRLLQAAKDGLPGMVGLLLTIHAAPVNYRDQVSLKTHFFLFFCCFGHFFFFFLNSIFFVLND